MAESRDVPSLEALLASAPPAPFPDELGLRFTALGSGWAESELDVEPRHAQAQGLVHAGALATMADHTAGAAGTTVAPAGHVVVTAQVQLNLLRAAIGPRLRCRAEVVKAGRTLTVAEARVHAGEDPARSLCALAVLTLSVVPAPG
jgi:uncharacterized protein (TIGR00369 family)